MSGPEGRIEVSYGDGGSGRVRAVRAAGGPRPERSASSGPCRQDDVDARASCCDFADAVRDGSRPDRARRSRALHILEATLAVYLSAATGETVGAAARRPTIPSPLAGVAGLAQIDLPAWSPVRGAALYGIRAAAEG